MLVLFACTPADLGIYLEFPYESLRTVLSTPASFATNDLERTS